MRIRKERPLVVSKMELSEKKNIENVRLIKIGFSEKLKNKKFMLLPYHKPISTLSCWYV
jgi:hypothetical protein